MCVLFHYYIILCISIMIIGILAHFTQLFKSYLLDGTTLYADLPGLRASENPATTIPTSVTATTARPDVVVIQDNRITLLELTVPTNTPEGPQEEAAETKLPRPAQ